MTDPLAPGRVPQVLFVPGGPREGVRQSKRVPLKEDEDPHGQVSVNSYHKISQSRTFPAYLIVPVFRLHAIVAADTAAGDSWVLVCV